MKNKIILFSDKKDCCGCGACMNSCPKGIISMEKDELGFIFPKINHEKCINCNSCINACAFQNKKETNEPKKIYAVARKDDKAILKSASGGMFAVIAESFIKNDGVVYGAALNMIDNKVNVKHIRVTTLEELDRLKGSKYVQSHLENCFKDLKKDLLDRKQVLFCGTPCQVASLNMYLRKKYDNLLTIDIICHGVPNQHFLSEYFELFAQRLNKEIVDFKFRDKSKGWGYIANFTLKKGSEYSNLLLNSDKLTYYTMFIDGDINRDSCYSCKYASKNRPADITIGDYWGIEKEHPEYLVENGGNLSLRKGISVAIVNTEKGESEYNKIIDFTYSYESSFDKVAKLNHQLRTHASPGKNRKKIIELYLSNGYKAVDNYINLLIIKKKILFKINKFLKLK